MSPAIYGLSAIWFLLPSGAANMAPVFAARLFPAASAPVDCGVSWRGKRLLGSHKTWRGLIAGVAVAAVVFRAQQAMIETVPWLRAISPFDYGSQPVWVGAGLGLAPLLGDLVKSLLKRQAGISPGRPWIPWDQIDWLIGTIAFFWMAIGFRPMLLTAILLVGSVLHLAVNAIGRMLGLRDDWI